MRRYYSIFCAIVLLATIAGAAQKQVADSSQTISKIPTTQKVVALTIDDGPHNKVTPEILAILREKHVKATFFVLGVNAEHFPAILAQEVADGHEIGMHTYSHPSLPNLSPQKIAEEFDKAEQAIVKAAPKPALFRPPGGMYNAQVIETAHKKGYSVILWSIDPMDWSCPPADRIIEKVVSEIKTGSIILLHDGQYPLPTPKALGTLIDQLRDRGYEFATVSELLQYKELSPYVKSTFLPFWPD